MNRARPSRGHGPGRSLPGRGEQGTHRWAALLADVTVDAEVAVSIEDTRGRHTSGRLTATGPHPAGPSAGSRLLRLTVDRPEVAIAALPAGALGGRHARRGLFHQLRGSGWRVELRSPGGLIATVDPERASRLAELMTGSPHLHLTPSVAALAASPRSRIMATTASTVVGTLGIALLVGLLRQRLRH